LDKRTLYLAAIGVFVIGVVTNQIESAIAGLLGFLFAVLKKDFRASVFFVALVGGVWGYLGAINTNPFYYWFPWLSGFALPGAVLVAIAFAVAGSIGWVAGKMI